MARFTSWVVLLPVMWSVCAFSDGGCDPVQIPAGLTVKDGFVEFIPAAQLKPFKDALPQLSNKDLQRTMSAPGTMWYDENSIVFMYQDSIETVVGGRANCVGRKTGEDNAGSVIGKLRNLFGPDYRFRFPFRKAAGTDETQNAVSLNFWSPPQMNGSVMPVKYWRPTSRSRWYWTFPIGTLFGEVLYEKAPDGRWIPFEIRTRTRYSGGWSVDVFRPFVTAESFAKAIMKKQPDWASSIDLSKLVKHLQDKNTLVSKQWVSEAYGKVFPPVNGALDFLPEVSDTNFIADLITQTTWVSAEGAIWKENGGLQTYAPSSQADFHLVPKGYEMGMIPVNEVSCNRCHSETGRRLKDFDFDLQLYGEIWGEDRIFTWHLFEPHRYIFATWDDADGSRKLSTRMAKANLVKNEKPSSGNPYYKPLKGAYVPENPSGRNLIH